MKKFIIASVIIVSVLFGSFAMAKVVTIPDTLSYVDYSEVGQGYYYGSVGKMYDSNANVVCYVLKTNTYDGNAISCVSLK